MLELEQSKTDQKQLLISVINSPVYLQAKQTPVVTTLKDLL